jgi:hypothetical protein
MMVQCAQHIMQLARLAAAHTLDLARGVAALLLAVLAVALVRLAAQLPVLASTQMLSATARSALQASSAR